MGLWAKTRHYAVGRQPESVADGRLARAHCTNPLILRDAPLMGSQEAHRPPSGPPSAARKGVPSPGDLVQLESYRGIASIAVRPTAFSHPRLARQFGVQSSRP